MTRALLDANVLVSGFIGFAVSESTLGELMRRWRREEFQLVVSDHILNDVGRTLQKPYFSGRVSPSQAAAIVLLQIKSGMTAP